MSRAYVSLREDRGSFLHGLLDECCTDATSPRMADEAFLFFRSFEGNLYQHTPKRDTHCKPCQLKEEIVYSSCWQSVTSLSSWKQHIDMFFQSWIYCKAPRSLCYTTKDRSMLQFCTIHYPVISWDAASTWSLHHPQHQITPQNTVDGRTPLHRLIGSLSQYSQGFIHPRICAGFLPSTVSSWWFRPLWKIRRPGAACTVFFFLCRIQNLSQNPKSKIPKLQNPKSKIPKIQNPKSPKSKIQNPPNLGRWGPHIKICYITVQNPKSKIQNPQNPKSKNQNPQNPKSKIPKMQNPKSEIPKSKIQNPPNPKSPKSKIQNPRNLGPHKDLLHNGPKSKIQNPQNPKSKIPKIQNPKTKIPKIQNPKSPRCKIQNPKSPNPKSKIPQIQNPKSKIPKIQNPKSPKFGAT